jgi:NADP-dependent 3-hydroxy acid dehydrogenase YdfG
MATSIALKGIDVILTYRSNEAVAIQTVQSIKAIGQKVVAIQLDITDSTSIDSFVKQVLENRFLS